MFDSGEFIFAVAPEMFVVDVYCEVYAHVVGVVLFFAGDVDEWVASGDHFAGG